MRKSDEERKFFSVRTFIVKLHACGLDFQRNRRARWLLSWFFWIPLCSLLLTAYFLAPIVTGRVDGGPSIALDEMTVLQGRQDLAILTLDDGSKSMATFRFPSVVEKAAYASRHNYTLIVCPRVLDSSRHAKWSKLRLVFAALREYPMVVWLDIDTLIWDPTFNLLDFLNAEGNRNRSFVAQLDLPPTRKFDHIFNTGVFAVRNTTWARNVLQRAYMSWGRAVFWWRMQDGPAMNEAMMADNNRNLRILPYGGLWHGPWLPFTNWTRHPVHKDARILHFPNCVHTGCDAMFRFLHRETLSKY